MEEEWNKVALLDETENLVTQKNELEESKKYWQEILDEKRIEHKFKIEETTQYTNGNRYKGQLQTRYVLNLYAKSKDIELIKRILNEYSNLDEENQYNQEEIHEEYEELLPRKLSRYFIVLLMIMLLIFEIVVLCSSESRNRTTYAFLITFMIIEIFIITKLLKRKKKRK